jgi:hypothetical protein
VKKKRSQDIRSPGRDLNSGQPEYATGGLTTLMRYWITSSELHEDDPKIFSTL